jgi:hypothetical protein
MKAKEAIKSMVHGPKDRLADNGVTFSEAADPNRPARGSRILNWRCDAVVTRCMRMFGRTLSKNTIAN